MDRVAGLPTRLRRPARRRLIELGALALYAVVAGWVIHSVGGLPAARDMLLPLVLGLLLALSVTSVARLRRIAVGLAVDWLPFVLALWLYDLIRGWADGAWMPVHYGRQIQLDKFLGLGSVPTVWLQQHLWHGADSVRWYDYATWGVYMSYFFTPTLVLAVLWWRSPALFRRLAVMVVVLAVLGCTTYVLFPAAPPWLAAEHGLLPPLDRMIGDVNLHVPVVQFGALWEKGNRYANDVAAVPSLHAGFTLLVTLFVIRRLRSPFRHLLWLYPLAMAFALVYAAEHYLCDILLGWIYCLVVYAACEWAFAARARTRAGFAAAAAETGP